MYRILKHTLHIPGLPEEFTRVFPRSGMKFRHTAHPLSYRVWWSQIWHCTHILFNGKCRPTGTHIHIWSHSRHASELWIPTLHYLWICGCQHTECHLSDTELLRAGAAHPAWPQLNIWIHAELVCEGRRLNVITVMHRVNLSIRGRCPLHAYRRCTALDDE